MAVDQKLDQRLRSAIRNEQLLEFNYKGNDRVVEPHDYGIQNGIVSLLCWQVGGRSGSRVPGWCLVDVASPEIERSLPLGTIDGRRFYPRRTNHEVALTRHQQTVPCKLLLSRRFLFLERAYQPRYILPRQMGKALSVDSARFEVGAGGCVGDSAKGEEA
jgi:hypothetical protein